MIFYFVLIFSVLQNNYIHTVTKIESHIKGKKVAIHNYKSIHKQSKKIVLLLHGSSFPSRLSFGFRLNGKSWIDELLYQGYSVYALDFLGYGNSDRYTAMKQKQLSSKPLGTAKESVHDVQKAVQHVLAENNVKKISIIAHSWGTLVAGLYATKHPEIVESLVLYASIAPKETNLSKPRQSTPAYNIIDVNKRIQQMNTLAPETIRPLLADEIFTHWGQQWLDSDPLHTKQTIIYPSGPKLDINKLLKEKYLYLPENITCNVLVVRGEYDTFPTHNEAYTLFKKMINAKSKTYVTLDKGTHVMHLETGRTKLYTIVNHFLNTAGER